MRNFPRTVWAFLLRDLQTEISYRLAFLLSAIGLFVSATVWYFMARFITSSADPARLSSQTGGLDYYSFALVGLMVNRFLDVALHSFSSSIRSEQATGTLEAMLVTPARLGHVVLASSAYSYLYAGLQAAAYLVFGVFVFGVRLELGSLVGAVLAVVLTSLALSGIGILSAGFVLYFKRGNPLDFVISSLSLLFGNVIIPQQALPAQISWISHLVPVYYANNAVRGALLQGRDLATLAPDLLALLAFSAVLVPLGLLGARIAVRRAKQEGSLIQY